MTRKGHGALLAFWGQCLRDNLSQPSPKNLVGVALIMVQMVQKDLQEKAILTRKI